jgi:hypothetical protein
MGLVWNSMMSMAGGWFFLMINESFRLGNRDFRLPGIGAYMSAAVDQGRIDAMLWAMFAMLLMIVGLDQFMWRPIVVWAQKFRVEEGGRIAHHLLLVSDAVAQVGNIGLGGEFAAAASVPPSNSDGRGARRKFLSDTRIDTRTLDIDRRFLLDIGAVDVCGVETFAATGGCLIV